MDPQSLVERVQELADVELATLLCLVAGQHCIIQTEPGGLDSLEQELQLVAANIFGLSHAVLHCSESTTLEDFSNGILVASKTPAEERRARFGSEAEKARDSTPLRRGSQYRLRQELVDDTQYQDDRRIANIIIARDLNQADHQIQIQALELLRTNRIFTHTAVFATPKTFLVVFLLSSSGPHLVNHLNDHVFISHYHDPEDGFPNLEAGSEWAFEEDQMSLTPGVRRSEAPDVSNQGRDPIFGPNNIQALTALGDAATVTAEVKQYLQNIVTFLRLHRAVAGGITPRATRHFDLLVKHLAPLHGLEFVTPSLVALAARKIYPHRIAITTPENERSMQYGSDLAAVAAMLEGVTPEQVIDEVLGAVEVPL
ncbi:MAG: hypothetical protein FRX48_07719 [Lasallia pustulata]|uniref:magnesium chelatase n=1 Tax=Lasallia pustulata TaxID=136370 RepID=A0A5M8PGX4_9LECA|nr:MAG: hypothetical protein FRX48_07719 [Lasallia pustulata]